METQKIKAILSAVKHKSLSKAAEEVSYTPSAMSHIADAIERELGVKILARTPLGVTLTKEGEALYAHMVALVDAERALTDAARILALGQMHHLRIGVGAGVSQTLLFEIIDAFRTAHPEVRVSMVAEDDVQDVPDSGEADVIFTDESAGGAREWIPVGEDPYALRQSAQRARSVGFATKKGAPPTHAAKIFIDYLKGERDGRE